MTELSMVGNIKKKSQFIVFNQRRVELVGPEEQDTMTGMWSD